MTLCFNGHDLSLYGVERNGRVRCKRCASERNRRYRARQKLLPPRPRVYRPVDPEAIAARIMTKFVVDPVSGCWNWTAAKGNGGYGQMRWADKLWPAYRLTYVLFKGPIPTGLEIDHLCRVPSCVNPDHLEAVTHRENMLRGNGIAARNAAKTHCPKGHEYTPDNTYRDRRNRRTCRTCFLADCKRRYHAKKARTAA